MQLSRQRHYDPAALEMLVNSGRLIWQNLAGHMHVTQLLPHA